MGVLIPHTTRICTDSFSATAQLAPQPPAVASARGDEARPLCGAGGIYSCKWGIVEPPPLVGLVTWILSLMIADSSVAPCAFSRQLFGPCRLPSALPVVPSSPVAFRIRNRSRLPRTTHDNSDIAIVVVVQGVVPHSP